TRTYPFAPELLALDPETPTTRQPRWPRQPGLSALAARPTRRSATTHGGAPCQPAPGALPQQRPRAEALDRDHLDPRQRHGERPGVVFEVVDLQALVDQLAQRARHQLAEAEDPDAPRALAVAQQLRDLRREVAVVRRQQHVAVPPLHE